MKNEEKIQSLREAMATMTNQLDAKRAYTAAAVVASGAGLLLMLEYINDTLEEIRDAIRGEK